METYLNFLMWLCSIISVAILSAQIAYESTIVQEIKKFFFIDGDYLKLKYKWWFKPIVWLYMELFELVNCPFCISFWIMLWVNLNIFDFSTAQSIILAPIAMGVVHIYRKLTF